MITKVHQLGDVTVVQVSGQLNLEQNESFRHACLKSLQSQRVVFCLDGLKFVGSSGIQGFFRALGEVNDLNPHGVKISGVKQDFLRVLQYTMPAGLEIHESVDAAVSRFAIPAVSNSDQG
ncbi:MAG: STAS domain-containing protein [Bdellovibrionaceae bacterium]|nr:STAS domain-containing protein [Pseudobdellovibrionaceae bacterium]MBX3034867.1 STAS domain-containing protein [Pseudobdellovibrionaceae bacterium]